MATKILPSSSNHGFENECREIHDSWGRLNLNQLVRSLATRSKQERQQIRETYKSMYGEDVTVLLQKMQVPAGSQRDEAKLDQSKLCSALSMWMLDPHERDAIVAREAFEHEGETNFKALAEIFVGRKSSHITLIKQAYHAKFRRHLDQDIINLEPPHAYQKILVALAASHKAHQVDVSQHIAKCDARRLYEAGEGSSGIEEAVLLEILSKRSIPQMRLTFSSYNHIYGHEYTKSLKKGNSKEFEDALKTVIKCMCNPLNYYAKALYTSIKGTTTSDKGALARVMISRAEIDMDGIQKVFKNTYGVELRDAICESIPYGDYRDFVVALITKATTTSSQCP
ncbi:hypothetical protein Tsubulata_050014 [Turnera subulata]|uniref:Annexin n=1 Tax=Turnera subulata TaxID=218843 RepID=A0A9Q0F3W2_9ROSI|nr:hypothetical protein Tsubulata_050014 [Turnera subulata]